MTKNIQITNGGIEKILNMTNINKEENIDMYFTLIDSKILNKSNNLYICKLNDNIVTYDNFILKSTKSLLKNSIIHIKKIRITLSNNIKIISCLNYGNFGPIKIEENKNGKNNKKDSDRSILSEELNEDTNKLLGNLRHEKMHKKYFFKWDEGNLKLIDNKTNKEKKYSVKKTPKKEKEKNFDLSFDSIDNDNIPNENQEPRKIKSNKEDSEDKEEIEKIFEGVNINELYKSNQKRSNRKINIGKNYQLIINLTGFEKGKPMYIKCINKILTNKENQKYVLFIFRDPDGAEIGAYVYGDDITNINKKIVQNGVYLISNYSTRPRISSTFINCDYRLILNNETNIESKPPDSIFNQIQFHCLMIDELFYFKEGTIIDICGIIYDEGKTEIKKTIYGNKLIRNILICDTSKKKIYISIWEPHCTNNRIKFEKGEIIAIKYCKVLIYPAKIKKLSTISLSIIQNSTSDYEKDLLLKNLYNKYENEDDFCLVLIPPNYKYIEELRSIISYNIQNKIDNCNISFTTKGYIEEISIDEKSIFNGCPFCNKKLKELLEEKNDNNNKINNFKYNCLSCKKMLEKPKYTFKLSFTVRDINSKAFFNMLGDVAKKFLDIDPEIVKEYLETKNFFELKKIEQKVLFKEYIFIGHLQSYFSPNKRLINRARVENFEKAEGEHLKNILKLIDDEE